MQNRPVSTISNLSNQFEPVSAAESRSRDLDIDKETAELTRAQRQLFLDVKRIDARQTRNRILQSVSLSVIAQMNAEPEALLQLFA
ncbi:MAG: flagellin-like hook-associated protein FlgL [Hyphomicrobiaceae bacterium]